MPIFTSLLLLFVGVAILSLALRSNGMSRERRERARDEERFATGALICEAAARDSFGVELDHSMESIAKLDALISEGWSEETAATPTSFPDELSFVLASYLGDVFFRHANARWQRSEGGWSIGFQKSEIIADPFGLIERKLHDPKNVHLHGESDMLLHELMGLRNSDNISQVTTSDSNASNPA